MISKLHALLQNGLLFEVFVSRQDKHLSRSDGNRIHYLLSLSEAKLNSDSCIFVDSNLILVCKTRTLRFSAVNITCIIHLNLTHGQLGAQCCQTLSRLMTKGTLALYGQRSFKLATTQKGQRFGSLSEPSSNSMYCVSEQRKLW